MEHFHGISKALGLAPTVERPNTIGRRFSSFNGETKTRTEEMRTERQLSPDTTAG